MAGLFRRNFVVVSTLFVILSVGYAELMNFGMCKDPECSEPLGLGETTSNYNPPDEDRIHFKIGQKVKIYSKDAGFKNDLIGVEINGKRGYAPKDLVRQTKLYKAKNMTLVPAKSKFSVPLNMSERIGTKSDKKVKHSISTNEPASFPAISVGNTPSTTSQLISSDDEGKQFEGKVSNDENNLHSKSEGDANSASHSKSELRIESNHLIKTSFVDVGNSDAVEHQDTREVIPSTQSCQNGFQTSGESDTTRIMSDQYSPEHAVSSDHSLGSLASDEDTEKSEIKATSVQNVSSYSTESFEHEHSSLTETGANLHSSIPTDMSNESIIPAQTEDAQLENLNAELSNTAAKITESLPRAVEAIVESFSEDSMKTYQDSVKQTTSSSLQELYKKDSDTLKDQIDATLALLQKRGLNASDLAADINFNSDSTAESAAENSVDSKNAELHNGFYAQNSVHAHLSGKLPLVHNLKGLKNSEKSVLNAEKHNRESEKGPSDMTQSEDHFQEETVNSGGDELPGDEVSNHELLETSNVNIKDAVETIFSSNADSQNSHTAYKRASTQSAHIKANSKENTLHTASRGVNHITEYVSDLKSVKDRQHTNSRVLPLTDEVHDPSVDHSALPTPFHDSLHPDMSILEKNDGSQMPFTDVQQISSEGAIFSTKDHDPASVESESYLGEYSSSTTETSFISRHLKSEMESDLKADVQYEKQDILHDSSSFSLSLVSETFNNSIEALRSFTEAVILLFPEPFQLYLVDLQSKGVPPRATVFTALIAIPTILLFITVIYIRQSSKEKRLLVKLSSAEQKLFSATTERDVLKEDVEKLRSQLDKVQGDLDQEQTSLSLLRKQLEKSENLNQSSSTELRAQLKDLENHIEMKTASVSALQTALEQCKETNNLLQRKLQEEENAVSSISVQLQEFEEEARTLHKEKEDFIQSEASCKEKIVDLEQSCDQLLQEAEVWNSRVNELTQQLQNERSCHEELKNSMQSKDSEIQSLQNMVLSFEVIQELKNSDDVEEEIIEEKMKQMLDTSAVQIKLTKVQNERNAIVKSFESERNRVMELEIELLEARSEIEKVKSSYNQALQDKTESQTKLEVLSNYFKDKEVQLQKELGVQEAVRQQKEEDASFAARRVNLIEEENSSYKYQVATLKQEIEETERNYKNQVALQEKKAHDNWLAARAAERKLEDVKQEAAQLRQRLTLLEREQENWLNSSRDEIVRPVPKRPAGSNGEIGTQDVNRSKDSSSGSLPLLPDMIPPLHPPVLPIDRPLPPVRMPMMEPRGFPPPPMDPFFDFGPPMHFPPQRWHIRGPHPEPLHPLDRRTPASYERGRLTPPPRRHQSPTVSDRVEIGRRSASPKEVSSRGSHTSSPPHPLPLFHDIPPPPGAYDFSQLPPPPLNPRYPLPPPPRRDFLNHGPGLTRTDSRSSDMVTSTPRGAHQLPAAQDRKQHQQPSSRV